MLQLISQLFNRKTDK